MKKLIILLITTLIAFGCANYVEQADGATGDLTLTFNNSASRTIFPDVDSLTNVKYKVTCLDGPGTFSPVPINSGKSVTITGLTASTLTKKWKIQVDALIDGKVIASGIKDGIVITGNVTTNEKIDLYLMQSDNEKGNTQIVLDWTFDVDKIDNYEVKIRNIESASATTITETEGPLGKLTFDPLGIITYIGNLPSGDYIFIAKLKKGTALQVPYCEVIQVYDNLDSNDSVTYNAEDFNASPNPPEDVLAKETINGIKVTWTDNSNTEDGYTVIRVKADGTRDKTETLPGGSISYIDTDATQGEEYTYIVIATSSLNGDSAEVESNSVIWKKPVAGSGGVLEADEDSIKYDNFDIRWTAATDNEASTKLKYKVVISTNNNIKSVAQTNIDIKDNSEDKWVEMDWASIPNPMPLNISGLTAASTYYINVLVRDDAGNIVSYNETSDDILEVTTATAHGQLGVSITIKAITDLEIVFQKADGSAIEDRDVFTSKLLLKTKEVYDSYTWVVDGDIITTTTLGYNITPLVPDGESEILEIKTGTLSVGIHNITVICKEGNNNYSKTLRVIIGN